ncbi:MAG: hypothetical protein WAN10_00180 [Candidatus Acidiferrales bacterium]
MFRGLKRALVESFVGAIALGYLLAQGILLLVNVFDAPIAGWVEQKQYREILSHGAPTAFPFADALPELAKCLGVLLVWYLLLRWLYFPRPALGRGKAEVNGE